MLPVRTRPVVGATLTPAQLRQMQHKVREACSTARGLLERCIRRNCLVFDNLEHEVRMAIFHALDYGDDAARVACIEYLQAEARDVLENVPRGPTLGEFTLTELNEHAPWENAGFIVTYGKFYC